MRTKFIIGIYKITNPKGRIYIGQSVDCIGRRSCYKGKHCKDQPRLYNSLKKYGWDAHKFEVIHECSENELNDLEVYYIQLFQCYNTEHGLNLQQGGQSTNRGYKPTDEIKKKVSDGLKTYFKNGGKVWNKGKKGHLSNETLNKLSVARKKRITSEATKKKMSLSRIGWVNSPETRRKLSIANTGKKHTESAKLKVGLANKGRKRTLEVRNKISEAHSIPVIQLTKDYIFVREWKSMTEVKKENGYNSAHICSVCKGKRKSAHGFIWKYKNL